MGDIPLAPLPLQVVDTTSAPRSQHRYRPGRPVRSAEHAHVVPDVPPALRRAVCGACGGGEAPCQRHVSPRNPSRFETSVDTSALAVSSPHAVTSRDGPNRVVIMSARTSTPPAPLASRTARRLLRGTTVGTSFGGGRAAGIRRVGRQSPPPAPPHPRPHSPPAGPTARHRLRVRCPGPPRQSPVGVTQTTPSATHPVHLRMAGRASATRVGSVRGVAGMAQPFAADLPGLALTMAAFRRRSSWR